MIFRLNYNSLDLADSRFVQLHFIKAKPLYMFQVQTIIEEKLKFKLTQ